MQQPVMWIRILIMAVFWIWIRIRMVPGFLADPDRTLKTRICPFLLELTQVQTKIDTNL